MLELLIYTFIGCLVGVITGLTPGVHINTVAAFILSIYFTGKYEPLPLCAFIIGVAVTHSFLDFIPSLFLGAPDPKTALCVLPGHKMLLEGRGYEALCLSIVGGIFGMFLLMIMFPFMLKLVPLTYSFIRPYIHFLLIAAVSFLILKGNKKALTALILLAAGIFGLIVNSTPYINANYIYLPVFSGLFGVSSLILSLKSGNKLPKQDTGFEGSAFETLKGSTNGFIGGALAGILPGLGSAQTAALLENVSKERDEKRYLIAVGCMGTIDIILSIIAIYIIGNPRSGSAVVINKIISGMSFKTMLTFMGLCFFSAGIAGWLALFAGKKFIHLLEKINYKKIAYSVIAFVSAFTFYMTGFAGLFILTIATAFGVLTRLVGVRMGTLMGVLLIPTILFFAGVNSAVLKVLN